jgi:hypothetical protein
MVPPEAPPPFKYRFFEERQKARTQESAMMMKSRNAHHQGESPCLVQID